MTTIANTSSTGISSWPAWAAGSAGLAAVYAAIGTFWSPLASYDATRTMADLRAYLVVLAMIGVGVTIAFGLVVRRATPSTYDRRAMALVAVSVLSLAVFWTGLPVVLAGAAACCALAKDRPSTKGRVTLALAVVVTAVAGWAALAG